MSNTLAINGGTPVRTKPWGESNALGQEEKDAVLRVMENGHLSLFQGAWKPTPPYSFRGGPEVQALEAMAQKKFGVKHAVAVNSASSGLSAAIGALGIGFGDEVIGSPFTMSACAMAPLIYGAIPVFADVTPEGSLDPVSVRALLSPRTKAIMVIHQFGVPAEMDEILAIAKEHNLKVIEDCAQAWDAKYKGRNVGTLGNIGIFSLNVHKTIQCGEGGICVTNDDETALRLQMIRNHGESVVEAAGYENITNIVGNNFRMTELQAAVAQEQLKKLDGLNAKRIGLVRYLADRLKKHVCLTPPSSDPDRTSTYYVFPLRYDASKCNGIHRDRIVDALLAEGVPFIKGYTKPLYTLPLFQRRTAFKNGYPWAAPENKDSQPNYDHGACPMAEKLSKDDLLLSLFICPPQTDEDMQDIADAFDKVLNAFAAGEAD